MNILYTFNDKFVPQVASSIISVCENNQATTQINFFVISMGITKRHQQQLRKMVEKYGRKITFYELDDYKLYFDYAFDTGSFHPIILVRLLLDKFLPKDVDKIIYMDGDTICVGNLNELYSCKMDGKIVGMCMEPTVNPRDRKKLNLRGGEYYNSGVMLIDLKKWRKEKVGEKMFDYLKINQGKPKFVVNDQDILNVYFRDRIYILPPKYNYTNMLDNYNYKTLCKLTKPAKYVSKGIFDEARREPVVIHYLGFDRPWYKYSTHKYRDEYKKYLKMTEWKDTQDDDSRRTFFALWKIFNVTTRPFGRLRYYLGEGVLTPIFNGYLARQLKPEKDKIINEQKKL